MISKNGSLETYCCEDISLIENYEEAVNSPLLYDCHHKNEIEMKKTMDELIELGLYWNRPASELIFIEHGEHARLHSKGKILSDEHKRNISEGHKGQVPWNKGKRGLQHMSEDAKKKISEAIKGENHPMYGKTHSEEARKKISEANKGRIPWNKGKKKVVD